MGNCFAQSQKRRVELGSLLQSSILAGVFYLVTNNDLKYVSLG